MSGAGRMPTPDHGMRGRCRPAPCRAFRRNWTGRRSPCTGGTWAHAGTRPPTTPNPPPAAHGGSPAACCRSWALPFWRWRVRPPPSQSWPDCASTGGPASTGNIRPCLRPSFTVRIPCPSCATTSTIRSTHWAGQASGFRVHGPPATPEGGIPAPQGQRAADFGQGRTLLPTQPVGTDRAMRRERGGPDRGRGVNRVDWVDRRTNGHGGLRRAGREHMPGQCTPPAGLTRREVVGPDHIGEGCLPWPDCANPGHGDRPAKPFPTPPRQAKSPNVLDGPARIRPCACIHASSRSWAGVGRQRHGRRHGTRQERLRRPRQLRGTVVRPRCRLAGNPGRRARHGPAPASRTNGVCRPPRTAPSTRMCDATAPCDARRATRDRAAAVDGLRY